MTSYDAWLDTEEVKRLAGQLLEPVPAAPSQAPADPSFGADFVGFAAEEPAVKCQPIPQSGGLQGLRQRFRGGLFILNSEGEAVLAEGEAARFQSLAMDFARSAGGSNVRLKVDATNWLELVPVGSGQTRRVLGTLVTEPLEAEALQQIESALVG